MFIWWIPVCRCNIDFKSLEWAYCDILIKRLALCHLSRTHFKWIMDWLLDRHQNGASFCSQKYGAFLSHRTARIELGFMVKDLHTIFVALHFATVGFAMIRKYIGFQLSLKTGRQILIQNTICMKHQDDHSGLTGTTGLVYKWGRTQPPYEHRHYKRRNYLSCLNFSAATLYICLK